MNNMQHKLLSTLIFPTFHCLVIHEFPADFKFGVSTSAYQIEGAWNADDKSESNWDYYTHKVPEKIIDSSNGDVACDAFNHIEEDVANLRKLNVDYYRFSLSWPRILPTSFPNLVSKKGISYYNKLINTLLKNDIQPAITIFHWDLPQSLQNLGGWANPLMADYFADYARECFRAFGDRVKLWITINDPMTNCLLGFGNGTLVPFYQSEGIGSYLCSHNNIRAHAKAYRVYEKEFKSLQKGKVGFTIDTSWWEPLTHSPADKEAADTLMQHYFGSYLHPLLTKKGDYPKVMRKRIDRLSKQQGFKTSRLPVFTRDEVKDMIGAIDFIGLNHYTTFYVSHHHYEITTTPMYWQDVGIMLSQDERWEPTVRDIFRVVPWGFRKVLNWIKKEYDNVEVIVTENGYGNFANEGFDDARRIRFFNAYLKELLKAIVEDGCNVTGYFAWSYMDNFEWTDGYTMKFGMYHVDFNDSNRRRTPKKSAFVYQHIITSRRINESLQLDDFMF